jgi:hypothetical protein
MIFPFDITPCFPLPANILFSKASRTGNFKHSEVTILRSILRKSIPAIAVIVLLSGISGCTHLQKSRDQARAARDCAAIRNLKAAVEMHYLDLGLYPASLKDLLENQADPAWRGPYISDAAMLTDAWGTPFRYEIVGGIPEITSAGPDRTFGTPDDLSC